MSRMLYRVNISLVSKGNRKECELVRMEHHIAENYWIEL